jgi:hypothetical protein
LTLRRPSADPLAAPCREKVGGHDVKGKPFRLGQAELGTPAGHSRDGIDCLVFGKDAGEDRSDISGSSDNDERMDR